MSKISNKETIKTRPKDKKQSYHDIYDRIFKRIITLSSPTIIRFINGLFDTDYPTSSKVTYNWTENVDDKLIRTIADTILTIDNKDSYHVEAQSYRDDNSIILRVFDYGYRHALKRPENIFNSDGIISGIKLTFPKQIVIYLDDSKGIPDEYSITLEFENDKDITINIPTLKYQEKELKEIIEKNLIILLPFKLLKIRDSFQKACESKNQDNINVEISKLREVYESDIIGTIEKSYKNNSISRADMNTLISLTNKLFEHLYSKYSSYKEVDNMLHDESLELEIDKYIDAVDDLTEKLAEKDNIIAKKDDMLAEKDDMLAEKDDMLAEKDDMLAEKDNQIAELQKQLMKYMQQ